MAYIRRGGGEPLSEDDVVGLARLVGVDVPADDLGTLAAALTDQLASMDLIDALDLHDVSPALEFDPRWHD